MQLSTAASTSSESVECSNWNLQTKHAQSCTEYHLLTSDRQLPNDSMLVNTGTYIFSLHNTHNQYTEFCLTGRFFVHYGTAWWLGCQTRSQEVMGSTRGCYNVREQLWASCSIHAPLSSTIMIWYWPKGSDTIFVWESDHRPGGSNSQADDYVTCSLNA